ncbi:MAG: hypothetical protein Q9225_000315 [Loekoesia sp. 1 TL-2023]
MEDPDSATITLADTTTHQGDLIIAADGVHSSAVSRVIGHDTKALPTGFSAFRFLIPTEVILADAQTRRFLEEQDGKFRIFVGEGGRRLVWYPCRAGTIQNFVAIHPDNERFASIEEWNISAKTSDVLDEFQSFHPDLVATIAKATDVKLWKLLYRQPIPNWHRGRLLLIGDAAHPMLPHQGQAGAQSIEDGAAIGILLQRLQSDSPKLTDEIEQRLEAFETVRRKRASLIQIFSNAGQDEAEKIKDEAARLLGDGLKVPSKYSYVLTSLFLQNSSRVYLISLLERPTLRSARIEADDSVTTANQAEFHEFNFGHDVMAESKRMLQGLVQGGRA